MPDAIDMAAQIEAEHIARGLQRIARDIPAGVPGECDNCGEVMPRLVDGLCGFCRDGRIPIRDRAPPDLPAEPEEPQMPTKSISIPPTEQVAIDAIEQRARALDCTQGIAAAELIVLGMEALSRTAGEQPVLADLSAIHIDALLAEVRLRLERAADQAALEAETARANAAEGKLAKLREALAA